MDNNKTVVEFKLKKRSFEEQINYAKNQLKKFPYEYRTFLFFKHQFTEIKEGIDKDTAKKINRPDLAAYRGHDWLISDWYILVNKYNIDTRFVNSNTEKYIMERVIPNIPENLKGKEISKWCNERCKEIFISKKRRRDFGYGIVFPFINGKPLKFDGIDGPIQIFVNDETGEVYRCKVTDKTDLDNIKYEIHKVK